MGDMHLGLEAGAYLRLMTDERLADRLWRAIGLICDFPVGERSAVPLRRHVHIAGHRIVFLWLIREDGTDLVYIESVRPASAR